MAVVDTNVLLHDSNSLFAFEQTHLVIPIIVLEELDTFKRENNELGKNARAVIRTLDDLRSKGHLRDGVSIDEKASGSVVSVYPSYSSDISPDDQILQIVGILAKKNDNVVLITKDINARVKADALGLQAEDYTKGTVAPSAYYKGWKTIEVSPLELKNIGEKRVSEMLKDESLYPNEYVGLISNKNPQIYKLYRHTGKHHFIEIPYVSVWGFSPRNIHQHMVFDLLTDDSIQLVSLLGPAGTGKTFIALLLGLFKVIKEHAYHRLLVSRPVIALGPDIGFLPGDLQEKLFHWMQPVYDNTDYIFGTLKEKQEQEMHPSSKKQKKKSSYAHEQERNKHPHAELSVEALQKKGFLSLEAITYMRGRSIQKQFVFIDEVQNLTPHEVKTIVSRAGEGTKVVLAGDPYQIDSPYLDFTSNGLTVTSEKCKEYSIFGTIFLEKSERSPLAQLAASIL